MATSGNGRKKGTSKKSGSRKTNTKAKNNKRNTNSEEGFAYKKEAIMLGVFVLLIFFFLCIIGVISGGEGSKNLGDYIKMFFCGIFGISAFYLPIAAIALTVYFRIAERDRLFYFRFGAIIGLIFAFGIFAHVITYSDLDIIAKSSDWGKTFYNNGTGGGFIFGSIALLLVSLVSKVGCIFIMVIFTLLCLAVFALPYLPALIEFAHREREYDDDDEEEDEDDDYEEEPVRRTRQNAPAKRTVRERIVDHDLSKLQKAEEEKRQNASTVKTKRTAAAPADPSLQLMNQTVTSPAKTSAKPSVRTAQEAGGISLEKKPESNNIHRVVLPKMEEHEDSEEWIRPVESTPVSKGESSLNIREITPTVVEEDIPDDTFGEYTAEPIEEEAPVFDIAPARKNSPNAPIEGQQFINGAETAPSEGGVAHLRSRDKAGLSYNLGDEKKPAKPAAKYKFPPINLLRASDKKGKTDDRAQLEETARRLVETLETFGVRVHVTDYSKGPAVTRYELQPELGVKVSKIVSLSDDIKLNLAASDIRIEAPIPGKQAVGIEVPNQVATAVSLRELFESKDFQEFKSNITFAVGKDIAGQVVVSDLAKMPHMLIAGATGSGKSVCINTLIMSILYKAHPDDVKLVLIDPKVVELSVYNGIPHLLLPVVTDPKQASAALQWGVNEMTIRYKKFADLGVRDLKGYNEKITTVEPGPGEEKPAKMPQVVIIVDELADLMMVAGKEVEESICRLAQLARAAGIHLIIATQRPSVDVITGLIKANMPSRIAFSVSSGIDSRTILDSNGAEKLLGKGDMLFFPQWLNKPSRVQGAFVSDEEVCSVVDFIKNQGFENNYKSDIPTVVSNGISGGSSNSSPADDRDEYFAEAGRFVIDKQKGSIGMLQRIFKIGFNRAARIMDQLEAAGVVGPEEGTKPRAIVMTMDEFEEYLASN